MAGRWASFNPILMDRFPHDFGVAYGVIVSLSETVTLFLSLMAGMFVDQTGSYVDTILILVGI